MLNLPPPPPHHQYEALCAYFVEGKSSVQGASVFGYSPGAFRVLCSHFRNVPQAREFFLITSVGRPPGVRHHDPVREEVIALRKKNSSVYDISYTLAEGDKDATPAAIRNISCIEGVAPLLRQLDDERSIRYGPDVRPVADVPVFFARSTRVQDLVRRGLSLRTRLAQTQSD